MRRTISILLAILLLCSFTACGDSQSDSKEDSANLIEVPNVSGMNLADARSTLNTSGFALVISNYDEEDIAPDRIVVTAQSPTAGSSADPEKAVTLSCLKKCKVYLDLTSDFNLFLNTYDLEIYFDDQKIGTISNGEVFSLLIDTLEGQHTLYAYKAGDNNISASQKLNITGDVTYSSKIIHGGSISFSDMVTADGVALASLEVPDVTGMVLEEAKSALAEQGFGNVKEEPYGQIWNTSNWMVVSQGIAPGSVVGNNEFLQLDCISLDDYFNNTYSGKTLLEVQELATGKGFSLMLEDADSYDDLTAAAADWSDDETASWTVARARQGAGKTAVVYISNSNEISAPLPEVTVAPEETSVPEETAAPVIVPKTYTDQEVKDYISGALQMIVDSGEYSVSIDSSVVNVSFAPEGITALAYQAYELKDQSALSSWNKLVSTAKQWSKDLHDHVSNEMNRPELSVALYYCHDMGTGNVLLVVMNGEVYYDFVNGIDLVTNSSGDSAPASTPEPTPAPAPIPVPKAKKHNAPYHSSDDRDIAKQGSSGVYAYKSRGMSYDIYYIIDMDEGYVYRFIEGNEDALCDRVKIDSGSLNKLVLVTYHDGGDVWQNAFCFPQANQPEKLLYQDQNGGLYDYFTTDLAPALKLRDSKKIVDY